MTKTNRQVNAVVNTIKVIKTVESVGVATMMMPVGMVIGACKGIYDVAETEMEYISNLWFKKNEEA